MKKEISRKNFLRNGALLGGSAFLPGFAAGAQKQSVVESGLKVEKITTFIVDDAIFVKVEADDGSFGWGECCEDNKPLMETFIHHGLKQEVIARDPFNVEPIWDQMFFRNHDMGPGGALPGAIAGIDIALWDLKGRKLGLPCFDLMGGGYRNKIKAYGSFGIRAGRRYTPKQAGELAKSFADKGFKVVKLRMQIREDNTNPEPDPIYRYVPAVRKALPDDVELFVDINNGYTANNAIRVGKWLSEEFNIRFYEEPCTDQNHIETRQVVESLDLSVIAGEKAYTRWQFKDLILHGNPEYLNPDPIKCGGFTEIRKIAMLAQAFNKQIICHNTRPTLSTAAALQFAASISNVGPFIEYPVPEEFEELFGIMKSNVKYEDGYLQVPDSPGLGIEVDEQKLRSAATSIKS